MISSEQIQRYIELPLVVDTELGRRMLPMGEVMALSVGSVIDLAAPFGSPVHLQVGGAPFASGEVVRIGNRAGVRVLTFSEVKSN